MLALKEFWKYKCYSKPEYNYVKSEKKSLNVSLVGDNKPAAEGVHKKNVKRVI